MPDVVIGPTEPATASAPLYEKYGTKPAAVSTIAEGGGGEGGGGNGCEGGKEGDGDGVSEIAAPRIAQPMRVPAKSWMIIARPATSPEEPPVVTVSEPLVAPPIDVYTTDVHGSEVTEPV